MNFKLIAWKSHRHRHRYEVINGHRVRLDFNAGRRAQHLAPPTSPKRSTSVDDPSCRTKPNQFALQSNTQIYEQQSPGENLHHSGHDESTGHDIEKQRSSTQRCVPKYGLRTFRYFTAQPAFRDIKRTAEVLPSHPLRLNICFTARSVVPLLRVVRRKSGEREQGERAVGVLHQDHHGLHFERSGGATVVREWG